jgi:two-component system chemotaxis response regulator CheB
VGGQAATRPPVVGIGASAGGVEALIEVMRSLPADLDAAVLIVLHLGAGSASRLAEVLEREGSLPVHTAVDGEQLHAGDVKVAPPDHHLMLRDGHVAVVQGPRENFHRPSIDVLFRSLAETLAARSIGVLLSGTRTDGSAELAAIRSHGGSTIVQSPAEALFPEMPQHAIAVDVAERVARASAIGPLIAHLVGDMPPATATPGGEEGPMESTLNTTHGSAGTTPPGRPAVFGCPECGGSLWEIEDDSVLRFRCRIGHGYSAEELLLGQHDAVEDAFWTAIRALEESADLNESLEVRTRDRGSHHAAASFAERARDARQKSELLRDTITKAVPRVPQLDESPA